MKPIPSLLALALMLGASCTAAAQSADGTWEASGGSPTRRRWPPYRGPGTTPSARAGGTPGVRSSRAQARTPGEVVDRIGGSGPARGPRGAGRGAAGRACRCRARGARRASSPRRARNGRRPGTVGLHRGIRLDLGARGSQHHRRRRSLRLPLHPLPTGGPGTSRRGASGPTTYGAWLHRPWRYAPRVWYGRGWMSPTASWAVVACTEGTAAPSMARCGAAASTATAAAASTEAASPVGASFPGGGGFHGGGGGRGGHR